MNVSDLYKITEGIPLKWERTAGYDNAIKIIGKNRKLLHEQFKKAALSPENQHHNKGQEEPKYILVTQARDILSKLLASYQIRIDDSNWHVLLDFAQDRTVIDYKTLLTVYKQRFFNLESHPTPTSEN